MIISLLNLHFIYNDKEKYIDIDFMYILFLHIDDDSLNINHICSESEFEYNFYAHPWFNKRGLIYIKLYSNLKNKL